MKRDYLDTLNKQQRKAATTTEGQVLVIAGAGSGKTTTMIYRVGYLIDKGVHPNNILLLTFTNKAANEMLARVKRLLNLKGNCAVEGGTFHSFAVSVLRTYPKEAGLRRAFTILDEDDNMSVIKHLMDTTDFPKGIKGLTKGKIAKLFSYAINTKTDLETFVASSMAAMFPTDNLEFSNDDTVQQLEAEDDAYVTILGNLDTMSNLAKKITAAIMRLWSNYVRYKLDHNMVSFDDLLVYLANLLKKKEIRKKLSKRFKYIMVDEYQDTNLLQIDIVRRLGMSHKNVMAVGDPAQSIYSFRGAYVNNIFSFAEMFKKSKCKVIKLGQNYRSTAPILDLANGVLNTFDKERKYSVELFTKTAKGNQQPELYIASSLGRQQSQARYVIDKIKERKKKGIGYDDIAILTRISRVTVEVELELYKNKIPFVKIGGVKFFDQAHMKDILAFLRIALNPKDVLAWKRLLKNIPGIGPKIADDIVKEFLERGPQDTLNLSRFKVCKYYEALCAIARTVRLTSKKSMEISKRLDFIYEWYKPIYEERYKKNTDKVKDPGLVAGEINAVRQLSLDYGSDLEQMMIDLSLDSEYAKNKKDDQSGKVVVSTIHGAKGLEWNTVFLISLIDGVLPSRAALFVSENLNEERRLLYVAATRAKKRLYLVAPEPVVDESNVVTRNSMAISRFLLEINDLDNLVSSNYKIAQELGHPK